MSFGKTEMPKDIHNILTEEKAYKSSSMIFFSNFIFDYYKRMFYIFSVKLYNKFIEMSIKSTWLFKKYDISGSCSVLRMNTNVTFGEGNRWKWQLHNMIYFTIEKKIKWFSGNIGYHYSLFSHFANYVLGFKINILLLRSVK